MSALDGARLIRFWMRKVRDLRIELARTKAECAALLSAQQERANSDYADLKADYEALDTENTNLQFQLVIAWQENTDLKATLGRSEDRRYQP